VRAEARIIVQFRRAGLIKDGRGVELPGEDLTAQPIAGLEERDRAGVRRSLLEEVRRHQPARPATDDCYPHRAHGIFRPVLGSGTSPPPLARAGERRGLSPPWGGTHPAGVNPAPRLVFIFFSLA